MANIYLRTGLTRNNRAPVAPEDATKILILNLMPNRAVTEQQFAQILAAAGAPDADIEITFCLPATHQIRRNADRINAAYTNFAAIKDKHFAALIVTGAPLDRVAFTDVDYWDEFREILVWRHSHVQESLFLCWGADAAGYADSVFTPHQIPAKITGIYSADGITMPQSRYFTIPLELTRGTVVAGTPELGALIVRDEPQHSFYLAGHFEYFAGTLADEYHRDRRKNGDAAPKPHHYFDQNMHPQYSWRASALKFYGEWLARLTAS